MLISVVELLTLRRLIPLALPLIIVSLLLAIPLLTAISKVIHRAILGIAPAQTLAIVHTLLMLLELDAVMEDILAADVVLVGSLSPFSLSLSLLLLLLESLLSLLLLLDLEVRSCVLVQIKVQGLAIEVLISFGYRVFVAFNLLDLFEMISAILACVG